MSNYVIRGDFIHTPTKDGFVENKDSYLVVEKGIIKGLFNELPEEYKTFILHDYTNKLIIPGFTDLHVHASQYQFRGLWMDEELLTWLNNHTFPEESKYIDEEYADKAYQIFVDDLKNSATVRSCIFATIHKDATKALMKKIDDSGQVAYVGKINMDRNSPDILRETKDESIKSTLEWLEETENAFTNVKPIITPRFIPSCCDDLLEDLGKIVKEHNLPVQSHLDESLSEIEWIKELCPGTKHYADCYDRFGLFGNTPTIMAHCVWPNDEEIALMKKNNVFVAHCPDSNLNLTSGIAPVKKFLDEGIKVGLGSDIAGGASLSLFKVITEAIQCSKMRVKLLQDEKALSFSEAFYIASKGGGEFFGKVGSFEEGFSADLVVLDDSVERTTLTSELSLKERLERYTYLDGGKSIVAKWIKGKNL